MTRLAMLVSLVAALAGCGPCAGPRDLIFLVRDPDPETQQLIDQCLAPAKSCKPLCEKVSGLRAAIIVHCEIHAQTDPAFTQVHVGDNTNTCAY